MERADKHTHTIPRSREGRREQRSHFPTAARLPVSFPSLVPVPVRRGYKHQVLEA